MINDIKNSLKEITEWPWYVTKGREDPPRFDVYSGRELKGSFGEQMAEISKNQKHVIVVHVHAIPTPSWEENKNYKKDCEFISKAPEYIDYLLQKIESLESGISFEYKPKLKNEPEIKTAFTLGELIEKFGDKPKGENHGHYN